MEALHTEVYRGSTINIYPDDDPMNPVENWDMLGTFTCFHRRYDLSCKKNKIKSPNELRETINKRNVISLPLYLYDHSGITISTTPFSCRWDSGQLGNIWCTIGDARKEFGRKLSSQELETNVYEVFVNEVKSFDDYLRGNCYGFKVEDVCTDEGEPSEVDSCWGYLGDMEYCLDEARGVANHRIMRRIKSIRTERAVMRATGTFGYIPQAAII